jgi:flagellar protein FlbD
VILVHRLRGEPMFVNADLIESIEATPDTVLTLVDGRRVLVEERPDAVVERVTAFRASLLVAADELRASAPTALAIVRDEEA